MGGLYVRTFGVLALLDSGLVWISVNFLVEISKDHLLHFQRT